MVNRTQGEKLRVVVGSACLVLILAAGACNKTSDNASPAPDASAPVKLVEPTGLFAGRGAVEMMPSILREFSALPSTAASPVASAGASSTPAASASAAAPPRSSASASPAASSSAGAAPSSRVRAYRVAVFQDSMSATLQLPGKPRNAYLVYGGKGSLPQPELLRMDSPTMLQPDDYAFFLDEVDLSLVPGMARDAVGRCAAQPCELNAVAVEHTGFDQTPIWRVWTRLPNGPLATSEYDLKGKWLKTKNREDPAMPQAPKPTRGYEAPR